MKNRIKMEEHDYTGEGKVLGKILANGQGLQLPPKSVGCYDITGGNGNEVGSVSFHLLKKPSWFHRTCTRFFLGWKWKDGKDEKDEKTKKSLLLG